MNEASLPAVAGDARRTPIVRAGRLASVCLPAAHRELQNHLVNGLRQRPASEPAGERPMVEARGFTCPERSRGNPAKRRVPDTRALAPASPLHLSPAASKGCQALPGLFRRKSLKTWNRGSQQVSQFCDVRNTSRHNFYSTMLPNRNRRNSRKTDSWRPCYPTINQMVGNNASEAISEISLRGSELQLRHLSPSDTWALAPEGLLFFRPTLLVRQAFVGAMKLFARASNWAHPIVTATQLKRKIRSSR